MTRISVIGLGAMGASYAAKLSRVAQVRVIADGERAARLERDGVTVNGERFDFPVVRPDEPAEPADLVLVGVKYTAFPLAVRQIAGHVGPGTVIVSLINGISSEDELATAFPQARVLYSITFGVDAVRTGQSVAYASLGAMAFGEARNVAPYAEPVRWLAALFDACGLVYEIPDDMIARLWWKFMVNVGVNQITAVLKAPYAQVQREGPAHEAMLAAQREVVAVAQAKGIALSEADVTSWLGVLGKLGPGQYTSMAQDAMAGRPMETAIFGGAMCRLGAETGVPVPVNTVLNQLLEAASDASGPRPAQP